VLQLHQKSGIDGAHLEDAAPECAAGKACAGVLGEKSSAAHQNLSGLRYKQRELITGVARAHDEPIEASQMAQFHAAGPVVIGPRAKLADRFTPLNYFGFTCQLSTTAWTRL